MFFLFLKDFFILQLLQIKKKRVTYIWTSTHEHTSKSPACCEWLLSQSSTYRDLHSVIKMLQYSQTDHLDCGNKKNDWKLQTDEVTVDWPTFIRTPWPWYTFSLAFYHSIPPYIPLLCTSRFFCFFSSSHPPHILGHQRTHFPAQTFRMGQSQKKVKIPSYLKNETYTLEVRFLENIRR